MSMLVHYPDVENEDLDLPGGSLWTTDGPVFLLMLLEEVEERYARKTARTATSFLCYWNILRINKI